MTRYTYFNRLVASCSEVGSVERNIITKEEFIKHIYLPTLLDKFAKEVGQDYILDVSFDIVEQKMNEELQKYYIIEPNVPEIEEEIITEE